VQVVPPEAVFRSVVATVGFTWGPSTAKLSVPSVARFAAAVTVAVVLELDPPHGSASFSLV
jgi:hypothetical protein